MNIIPTRKKFQEWTAIYKRVPIVGEKLLPQLNLATLFRNLYWDSQEAFLFESGKGSNDTSRYSIMGTPNNRYVKIGDECSTLNLNGGPGSATQSVSEGWDALDFDDDIPYFDHLSHFWGGWVGYIAYEAGDLFENLPRRKHNALGLPDAYFMQVDRVLIYDHISCKLKFIIATEQNCDDAEYNRCVEEIELFWKKVDPILEDNSLKESMPDISTSEGLHSNGFQSNLSAEEYKDRVRRAQVYIREGDIYQANIAQRFETEFEGDPLELYLKLRAINPAPFSGFLRFSDFSIVSSSPERLIKIQGDTLETRPIAGTRPRGDDAKKDESLTKELLLSEKERAEHLMLVDLERNDMGRVCKTGSVKVTDLMFLEQYSHVSHIVSNIQGKLKSHASIRDLLKALFPGGTITGCPKIRCMEIIHELEPSARGLYSGSFGYIGFSRQLDLNIIIRTIILKDDKAFFHVGAGIVADSNPDREYEETLAKAAAMIRVLSSPTGEH
ncbi:MAG TPA: aminodeoxychorismate synthase component I [Nitrospina sp.]|jgi:aminodeoxychorismate synthase component I|nr:aminodeoxychorismate synthase, component I [Nitrospinota bacterium]MDP6335736.1 aminodeoxychorismate synthase component I [Nitrospinaceae bacterium]HAX45755.1 aminodeoxychorismate synthase component I [Nitrospina sp.]|tara:strand:+ start:3622 stop:5115 length:1494 start_codon:yes stop_codon:yes gene_type:complete